MDKISFQPIARTDFKLMGQWLATPHVARWWHAAPSLHAIEAEYGGCIDGTELGHIMAVPNDAFSIDYFIGPLDALRQGLGGAMIQAFAHKLWLENPAAACIIVPTHARNQASWRSLARAGFRRVASRALAPDSPVDDMNHVIYQLDRPG